MKKLLLIFLIISIIIFGGCNNIDNTTAVESTLHNDETTVVESTLHNDETTVVESTSFDNTLENDSSLNEEQPPPQAIFEIILMSIDEFKSFLNDEEFHDIILKRGSNYTEEYYNVLKDVSQKIQEYNVYQIENDSAKISSVHIVQKTLVPDHAKWFDCYYEFEYKCEENLIPLKLRVCIPLDEYKDILVKGGFEEYLIALNQTCVPNEFDTSYYKNVENISVTIQGKEYCGLYSDVLSEEKSDYITLVYDDNIVLMFEILGEQVLCSYEENIKYIETFYSTIIK